MKKIKALLSAFAVSLTLFGCHVSVSGLEYCETLTYIVSENEIIITGYSGTPEILTLPSQIEGKPVTKIRENAFYKCDTLKEIIIPDSINEIGRHAFFECTSLEKAEIQGEIGFISEGVFYGCEKLEEVSTGKIKEISSYAFFNCSSLKSFNMPQSVSEVGDYAFANCNFLSKISVSGELLSIGRYAFYNCPNLTRISLPKSLESIGQYALGFNDSGATAGFLIVGTPDSIAEHYTSNTGLTFRPRITSESHKVLNKEFLLYFLGWAVFALIYLSSMLAMSSIVRKHKKRAALR